MYPIWFTFGDAVKIKANVILSAALFGALSTSAAMAPVAWWKMDKIENGKVADASGNGRDLTVGSDCRLADAPHSVGCSRPSLYMPGTLDTWAAFECPALESFTVAMWIRRAPGDGPLADSVNILPYLLNGLSGMNVQCPLRDTVVEPWFVCTDASNATRTCYPKKQLAFDRDCWQHIALSVKMTARHADGSRTGDLALYRNGAFQDGLKGVEFPATYARPGTAVIGNNAKRGERPMCCNLGDCRLYDTALTADQVAALADISEAVETTATAPRHQARAEVLWVKPICIERGRYIGWPTVCRIASGDLIAVFSGDRDFHVCPWGKVQMVRSSDGGETWTPPRTIANGPLDDRDAGIVQLPDGELLVSYFTSDYYRTVIAARKYWTKDQPEYWWTLHDDKISEAVRDAALGNFCVRSRDNGRTWTGQERFAISVTAPHGPILLADGSLFHFGLCQTKSGYCRLGAERSTDGGRTWTLLCGNVAEAKNVELAALLDEPHVLHLPGGRLLALIRINNPSQIMRQTHSDDGGRTWAPVTETGICGLPPHLISLGGERVACVYGRRKENPGFGEFASISDDGGRTWDVTHEITLAASHSDDLGYPSTASLPDGTLVTVYYQQRAKGEKPCLMATKWRVTQ